MTIPICISALLTLAGVLLAARLVLGFASRLSCRIHHLATGSTAGDHVGNLSCSFSAEHSFLENL
ncbi:hypothetical protein [Sedimenticola selenatireducens]|uniref:hypothetical protein n=1 Tax=Sedimenticola selenatireducens TaxID=191960 RepID=UPI0012F98F79|nr:hypothetical protein [Sedimenticola selenatireducens]